MSDRRDTPRGPTSEELRRRALAHEPRRLTDAPGADAADRAEWAVMVSESVAALHRHTEEARRRAGTG